MRIGINLLAIRPMVSGGIEFYLRNLLESLFRVDLSNEYILFSNLDCLGDFAFEYKNVQTMRCNIAACPQWKRIIWEQTFLPIAAKKYRLDLLHSPTYTWPVCSAIPGIVSILDMLYRVYPDTIPRAKLAFWSTLVPWSARRCRKILTISESSKRDIVKYLGVPPEKVTVTPLALDRRFDIGKKLSSDEIDRVCAKYGIRKPYLLCVGGVAKHKNSIALVQTLAILRGRAPTREMTLVIAGNDYGSAREIEICASACSLEQVVRLIGYVVSEDLPALYAGAFAYVTPSRFEGFGLTVLEAMAFGTPVVVSNRGSLPEVAGDAALVVDPENPVRIADAIARIAIEPGMREELVHRGLRRVEQFSWEQTAWITLQVYREVLDAVG